jgi:uncharacterized protein
VIAAVVPSVAPSVAPAVAPAVVLSGAGALAIECASAELILLPQRAAYVPAHRSLLVADLHIGKAVSFRRLGVPVPGGTTAESLAMLSAAIAASGAQRIVFLGDFLHSARARAPGTLQTLQEWRQRHAAIALTLVRGNHDRHAGDPPAALGIEVVEEPFALGSLQLVHDPLTPASTGYALAGHLHPCVHLAGRAHDRLRLPCFHFGERVGVLPAFGAFTGMHPIRREQGDRVYAIAEGSVRCV